SPWLPPLSPSSPLFPYTTLFRSFKMPVVTFIDTPGAYPGVGAEERGQSEAIARNLAVMSRLPVPIVCFVIGEGGSGGALAIGVRSEEHTSELQSRFDLVCRLLLE